MKNGVIQHLGTPKDIYQRPKNSFVATFIGHSNMLIAAMTNGKVHFTGHYSVSIEMLKRREDGTVLCSVRPEEFIIGEEGEEGIKGIIKDYTYLGLYTYYDIELETGDTVEVIQESTMVDILRPNTKVSLRVKAEKINIFNESGRENFLRND
jgi:iron(III) transport system ATP-binding protein